MEQDWMVREVPTPGGAFKVRQRGDGQPVVLLHDEMTTDPGAFGAALARDAHIVAPTHPGFGDADRPGWVQSIRDVADHYMDLVEALDLETFTVVGASMGAWIGLELALRLPDQVRAVSLVAPIGIHIRGEPAADYWYVRDRDNVLYHDSSAMPALDLDDQVANEESAARYGWTPRLHDPTLAPRLHRVRQPVQIVWSTGDRLLPEAHLHRWRELLPKADVVTVDDVGHFPTHEAPERTADLVSTFLTAISTGAAR